MRIALCSRTVSGRIWLALRPRTGATAQTAGSDALTVIANSKRRLLLLPAVLMPTLVRCGDVAPAGNNQMQTFTMYTVVLALRWMWLHIRRMRRYILICISMHVTYKVVHCHSSYTNFNIHLIIGIISNRSA